MIIIEFSDTGGSIQLTITYASYATPALTEESLLSSFPAVADAQAQPFPLSFGTVGLTLHYDPGHPDRLTAVWFGKNGYLYQLTGSDDGLNQFLPVAHSLTLF